MKILPDEIPAETSPFAEGEYIPAPPFPARMIRDLDNKNVFVSFKDRTSAVGHLACQEKFFYVGTDDTIHYYSDVESFREV